MRIKGRASGSLATIVAVAAVGGLAALILQAASHSGVDRSAAGACQASLAVYEQVLDRAEHASVQDANAEALVTAAQQAYEAYVDCVKLAAFSSAFELTPPPTLPRPPFTPPGHRGTPPPVEPPRGTPGMTPPGPPMTPPMHMTPPVPPPTHGRPQFTPPGPPWTPPRPPMTSPATPPHHP